MDKYDLNKFKEKILNFHGQFSEFKVFSSNCEFPDNIQITNSFEVFLYYMDYWTQPCEEEIEELNEHYIDHPESISLYKQFSKIYDFLEDLKSTLNVIYLELHENNFYDLPNRAIFKNNLEFDVSFRKEFMNFTTNTFAVDDFVNGVIRNLIHLSFLTENYTGSIPVIENIKSILIAGGVPCGVNPITDITQSNFKEIDPEFLVYTPKGFK